MYVTIIALRFEPLKRILFMRMLGKSLQIQLEANELKKKVAYVSPLLDGSATSEHMSA